MPDLTDFQSGDFISNTIKFRYRPSKTFHGGLPSLVSMHCTETSLSPVMCVLPQQTAPPYRSRTYYPTFRMHPKHRPTTWFPKHLGPPLVALTLCDNKTIDLHGSGRSSMTYYRRRCLQFFPKYREIFPAAKKEHGFCCIFPFSFSVFHDSALAHSRLKHVKPIPASRSMSCWTKITRHRPYDLSIALHLYASLPVVVISESGGSSNYQSNIPGAWRVFYRAHVPLHQV